MGSGGERPRRQRIVGTPVDAVSLERVVQLAAAAIASGERCRILVTNANKAWLAARDTRLRAALESAELVIPEWATVWAAERLGYPGIEYIGGLRLVQRLLPEAQARGWSTYFLGASADVIERMVARLRQTLPALKVVGWHHGYLDAAADLRVRQELTGLRPDLLFVAMGSPRQEHWIAELPPECARVSLGVGGSFDVLSGMKSDSPRWLRANGLEWLFRLAQDPRRMWRRYLVTNTWFVAQVMGERLRGRDQPSSDSQQ